jgi:RNA polymerase sigma-70 factor (ECF subfamily)
MTHSGADDMELLEAWRAGDAVAGSALLRRHFDALFRFFRARFDDGIADLVQRTLVGAVEARDRVPATSFRAYLFGIAHKQLLMEFRRVSSVRVGPALNDPPASTGASPSKILLQHEEQQLLLKALRRVPIEMQVVLQLYYWEELGTAEIAEAVGIPAGTVKSRLFRARQLVKESIASLASNPATSGSTMANFDEWARSLRAVLGPAK